MDELRGVILDVDGTLVDSNDAHAQSWTEAFSQFGYTVRFDEVRRRIGEGGDKLLMQLVGLERDSDLGEKISEWRKERFHREYAPKLRAFPRTRELLQRMRAGGLRLVVASSSERDQLDRLLKLARVDDLLEESTSSSDAERSKPDPDILHAAMDRLGLPASQAVMIGDTPFDIAAANRAGLPTIAFRCGGWHDQALAGAIALYDDPADLLAHYESSPLGTAEPSRPEAQP